jgi:hypothetical protein
MEGKINQFFKLKGYKIIKSPSARIIEKFDESVISGDFYSYLQLHPSCRVLFDILKNTDQFFIEPTLFLSEFQELLTLSQTSFIYIANCPCGAPLDKPNVMNSNFKLPDEKQITCHKCDTINTITKKSYEPFFEIKLNDFLKFINLAKDQGIFLSNYAIECIYCNEYELVSDTKNVDLVCTECKHIRYVMPKYIFDSFITQLISKKQGYWLEWYVWKQLKDFNFTLGKRLIKNENDDEISFEVDGVFVGNDKCIVIECKDTDDIKDTLSNLHLINEFADAWILVSTKKIRDPDIRKAKSILKNKFVHITPKDVDNVKSIVGEILKK